MLESSEIRSKAIGAVTRRGLLKAATALAAVPARRASAQQAGQIVAYVGAYTDRGRGIHMFYLSPSDGTLTPWKVLTGLPSPSSLAFHPNNRYLYAINEISNFGGQRDGSATSIRVDPATGDLQIMNVVSTGSPGPAHVAVDAAGQYVFAANYGGGTVTVFPIRADGSLGPATDVEPITGTNRGVQPAQLAPPGSFAISGHDAPHAHMAHLDPSGRFLLLTDLATDRIYIFRFDRATGTLTPNIPGFVQAYSGSGPRHFEFASNGRFLYSLNEESSTIDFMSWNGERGELIIQQTESTLPAGYEGTNYSSAILLARDGRFVYCGNRLHDTVAIFALDPLDGWMRYVGEVWTRGSYPRDFKIDPTGQFMYVLHSRSDNLTTFRVDTSTGNLTFTGKYTGVGNPSSIAFLTLT